MAEFKPTSKLNRITKCSWDQRIPNTGLMERNFVIPQTFAGKRLIPRPSFNECFVKLPIVTKTKLELEEEHKMFNVNKENDLFRLSYYNPKDTICYKTNEKLGRKNRKSINRVFESNMIKSVYPCHTKKWFHNQTRMKALSEEFSCSRPERPCYK
jgi:hypothetical protein